MPIAVGFDFSVPNNGPVKGARVLWYGVDGFDQAAAALHGGSEAIVQFAASEGSRIQVTGSGSSSPVTGGVTGEDGKVHIGVEGRGQNENLDDNARPVPKTATVRLHVALKGSDLFGDVREGGRHGCEWTPGTPDGAAERAHARPVGVGRTFHFSREGLERRPAAVGRARLVSSRQRFLNPRERSGNGAHTTQETETHNSSSVTVTDGVDPSGSNTTASLSGRFEGRYQRLQTTPGWVRTLRFDQNRISMNNTSQTHRQAR